MSVAIARRPAIIAASLWGAAGVIWLAFEAISAAAFRGYSYATNYISDLGVPEVGTFEGRTIDSPLSALMNFTFIAQGLLLLAGVVFIIRATRAVRSGPRRWIIAIASIHAVGMLLVGIFHGSQTNIESGFILLHGFGALLAIITGNLTAILIGRASRHIGARPWYAIVSITLGIVGLLSLVMLLVATATDIATFPEAVWERGSVYSIIGWELFTAASLIAITRRGNKLA